MKRKKTRVNLWSKVKGRNSIVLVEDKLQSAVRYLCLYSQQDIALWFIHVQIFPKQTKSQTILGLYLFSENRILWYPKPDIPFFAASAFGLNFFHLGSLILFNHFPCLKTSCIFKSLSLAHFLILSWNYQNRVVRNRKLNNPVFSRLVKFSHPLLFS
jgi:hypothetical protein